MKELITLGTVALVLAGVYRSGIYRWRRPRLRHPDLQQVAVSGPLADRAQQLAQKEAQEARIVPGAEGLITYADPANPAKTPIAYLYLHGLSACRQETAPVTETLAHQDQANAVYARIAGHGMGDQAMGEVDGGTWLTSVWEYWQQAQALGERVVIVATSTGAASALWLLEQPGVESRIKALLFMAPNVKVRNPLAFLLTWPGVEYWLPQVISPDKHWQPRNAKQAKYWSTNYGNQALIQMQLLLNHVQAYSAKSMRAPLMIQCSPDDPVINPQAAFELYQRWGGSPKVFRWLDVGPGDSAHVFVGDIMAPHRNKDVISAFREFLDQLPG